MTFYFTIFSYYICPPNRQQANTRSLVIFPVRFFSSFFFRQRTKLYIIICFERIRLFSLLFTCNFVWMFAFQKSNVHILSNYESHCCGFQYSEYAHFPVRLKPVNRFWVLCCFIFFSNWGNNDKKYDAT